MRSIIRAAAAAGIACMAGIAQAASIASVSPQGEVAQVRQVTVKFSEAVVAFGDLRLPDPLSLSCQGAAPAGAGRWASDRVWLYDFREPLPPGTRCTLQRRADWKPLNGSLTGTTDYGFNTGGPALVSTQPEGGVQIAEDQYFLLRLNGAAVEASVLANAWCEVEGIGERIGVQVIGGDARAQLLKARRIEKKEQIERALILGCKRPLPNAAADTVCGMLSSRPLSGPWRADSTIGRPNADDDGSTTVRYTPGSTPCASRRDDAAA